MRGRSPVRIAVVACVLTGGLGVSGCAALAPAPGTDAAASAPSATRGQPVGSPLSAAVRRADRTHEMPTPTPAGPPRVAHGWATPQQAVRAFAAGYVNWTAADVARRLRVLARESIGQARATLELQARETARDAELHRGRITNSGTVEAVSALPGAGDRYVVVTRERTSAAADPAYAGLAAEWHVALASVRRIAGGWVLSGWTPES